MNKTIKFLFGLAIVAFAISCEKLEPTPQATKSEATLTATPSATSVAIAAKDSLTVALTLTWNDPKYAVGLAQTKFTMMVGLKDQNFVSFQSKSFTGVLTGSLLGKEVNAFALKLGGVIGTPINLDVKVVSSQANNNETKSSPVTSIAVTPYGDLALASTATKVVATAANSSENGATFTWNTAFSGYKGVKTYQFQYAKGGTSFATPTSSDISAFTKSLSKLDLNKIALGFGAAAGGDGVVDFRIKATNEQGTVLYSNTITVTVTTYVAFNSIGIIGDATAGGWDNDTDLFRADPTNKPADWTVTLYLIGGKAVKFRADDKWDTNWGTSSGDNIPVATSGYYTVKFNAGSGAYSLTPVTTIVYNKIGLIGEQSSWGSEIGFLTKDPTNDQVWTGTLTLEAKELKFRANEAWSVSWGTGNGGKNTDLSGWGTSDNGGNIKIGTAGTYYVYINVATGEYFFGNTSNSTVYSKIGIIGDSTPGGWSTDTFLTKNPSNPYKWSGKVTLTNKEAKFRANAAWDVNWGNPDVFPNGIATPGGNNIKISTAGTYQITFNSATGEYSFAQ